VLFRLAPPRRHRRIHRRPSNGLDLETASQHRPSLALGVVWDNSFRSICNKSAVLKCVAAGCRLNQEADFSSSQVSTLPSLPERPNGRPTPSISVSVENIEKTAERPDFQPSPVSTMEQYPRSLRFHMTLELSAQHGAKTTNVVHETALAATGIYA